ncbi:uncharacterized protein PV09_03076 [Verruconis gallopava]|uniref:UDP-N-acetylglucosamine--dolichyl-phosphate N-acetylglucosaminephosphotransferase n=1 Tax=Verruconis gallopava TaxID=253628 RepID=A0A0D2AH38_9PEZI|nr:uncharacterized protein PV09_03076 [Verruconis gallopava]KIW05880.1 hypothetical protein PV09_03076 [Verruconis gallopava]
MTSELTREERHSLLAIFGAGVAIVSNSFNGDGNPIVASLAYSGIGFSITYCLIRWLGPAFMKAGFKGKDMSKARKVEIPETMGAVCALVYLLIVLLFIPTAFYKDIVAATSGGGNRDVILHVEQVETGRFLHRFPHNKLASYLSAVLTMALTFILGLLDDIFDIRWRHKVLIPAVSAIPMLVIYFVDFGVTHVVVPIPLRPYLGELFNLGWIYYAYMAGFAIFCPNSINILAGINGIEVLQSIIIGLLILLNDMLYLSPFTPYPHPATDSHLFSIYMLLPFLGVSLALFIHNKFPARVFVGDTYCYFAGMIFAIDGILGHFSKTLWLLFVPQAFNFVYSCPQLFGLVPCPRHRLPKFNARTGLMEPSTAVFEKERPLHPPVQWVMKLMHKLWLLDIKVNEEGRVTESSNFTLINLWLVWFGPMREDTLAYTLCAFQFFLGLVGLFVRHKLALLIFTADNWNV